MDEQNVTPDGETCSCNTTPSGKLILVGELGMDEHYAEVSLLVCPDCSQPWLRYFYEHEGFSRSGRWYLGLLSPAVLATMGLANAKETLEELRWYFYGGSYYEGRWGKTSGKIYLNP